VLWLVIQTGWDIDKVKDLDVLTFNAIAAGLTRIFYQEKAEQAWTHMVAAQGESKAMRELTNGWLAAVGDRPMKAPKNAPAGGAKEFLKALGFSAKGGRF